MSELAMIARCMICNAPFAGPKFVKIGLGLDVKNNRIAVFVEKLTKHIAQQHPEMVAEIIMRRDEYAGALFLSNFQTDDPSLKEQLDFLRWKTHQVTIAKRYTDQMIGQWVDQVIPELLTLARDSDRATLTANLKGMLLSMRDTLEEPGKYVMETGATVVKAS